MMNTLAIRLTLQQKQALELEAHASGTSVSELVRLAITTMLKKRTKKDDTHFETLFKIAKKGKHIKPLDPLVNSTNYKAFLYGKHAPVSHETQ